MNKYSVTIRYSELEKINSLLGPFSPSQQITVYRETEDWTVFHPDIRRYSNGHLCFTTSLKYIHEFELEDDTTIFLRYLTISDEDMIVIKLSYEYLKMTLENKHQLVVIGNMVVVDNVTTNRITESIRVNILNENRTPEQLRNGIVYLIV